MSGPRGVTYPNTRSSPRELASPGTYILTLILMGKTANTASNPARGLYRFYVREWYSFYVDVDANSEAEAMRLVEAFYNTHRRPQTEYSEQGVHAILDDRSVRFVRPKALQPNARSKSRGGSYRNGSASSDAPPAPAGGDVKGPRRERAMA